MAKSEASTHIAIIIEYIISHIAQNEYTCAFKPMGFLEQNAPSRFPLSGIHHKLRKSRRQMGASGVRQMGYSRWQIPETETYNMH